MLLLQKRFFAAPFTDKMVAATQWDLGRILAHNQFGLMN